MVKRDVRTVEMWAGPAWIEVRNRLVTEHLAWAHRIAAKVAKKLPTWFLPEDLTGAAEIALVKTADEYRSYQRTPFKAYALRRVRGACFDFARRKEYRERGHESLTPGDIEGVKHEAIDPGPSPERLAELEQLKGIWQHVGLLKPRQATVIRAMYGEGLTNQETARFMHVTEGYVSQLHAEALAVLREVVKR